MDKKYNLLLPIAGKAQRFIDADYLVPKPLIVAGSKHIIEWALSSVDTNNCNLIFAVRIDHIYSFSIDAILKELFGKDVKIVIVDHVTEGAVSTCLLAKEHINNNLPLFIYTPDVYFEPQFDPADVFDGSVEGFLLTFKANNSVHSYTQLDKQGRAVRVAEKEVISPFANVGVYGWATGASFITYAEKLIKQDIRIHNEFYIAPMYNLMIKDGLTISTALVEKMHVLGTPGELEFFNKYVIPRFGQKPVALCADHSGFDLKEQAKIILRNNGVDFIDFGTYTNKPCDYGDYVSQVIKCMENRTCDFGIGFCRTGQGINILANKYAHIRSALISDGYTARYAIKHNCANFFSIPSRSVNKLSFDLIVKQLKETSFDGGRHMTRMKKTIEV